MLLMIQKEKEEYRGEISIFDKMRQDVKEKTKNEKNK